MSVEGVAYATPEQRSLQRAIKTQGVILVEGRSAEIVFREFIQEHLNLGEEAEAFTFGEKESINFSGYLGLFVARAEFRERVRRLGIIRDAESNDPSSALESVRHAIKTFNTENPSFALPVPDRLAVMTPIELGRTQVAVFVLPDSQRSGMLETLCLEAIQEAEQKGQLKLLPCVSEFFACLKRQGREPGNPAKARFAGYALAADVIDPQLGRAAQKGVIPWEAKAFDPLKAFVRSIAGQQ